MAAGCRERTGFLKKPVSMTFPKEQCVHDVALVLALARPHNEATERAGEELRDAMRAMMMGHSLPCQVQEAFLQPVALVGDLLVGVVGDQSVCPERVARLGDGSAGVSLKLASCCEPVRNL